MQADQKQLVHEISDCMLLLKHYFLKFSVMISFLLISVIGVKFLLNGVLDQLDVFDHLIAKIDVLNFFIKLDGKLFGFGLRVFFLGVECCENVDF